MTDSGPHDATAAKPLLEDVEQEIETFDGDGVYGTWSMREHLKSESIHQITPPQKNVVIKQHGHSKSDLLERDESVRQIRRDGKAPWTASIGHQRRHLGEAAMSRLKMTSGDRLKNREPPNQKTEVALRTKTLNAVVTLGMPPSWWI